ncbi:MAG: hypothetical protein K2J08_13200 [Ruminococcus sp.]|nr:hypothetical protein [Ruminococcus sp.]
MIKGYEIERKFLVYMPDTEKLGIKRKIGITQTYLKKGENGGQRRIRRITDGGKEIFTYTEKLFVTAVTRKELEYEIDKAEYERLLTKADDRLKPVIKTRYYFEYKNQVFELDVYPFSEEFATMETELETEEQEIYFPDNVTIIKEVTGDSDYSNANLALAGAFPQK